MNYLKPLTIICGVMLLVAILPVWPYGYFQILRIVVTVTAIMAGYVSHKKKLTEWVWIMGVVAILFNPISPIFLDKGIWSILDLIASIIFLVLSSKLKYKKV